MTSRRWQCQEGHHDYLYLSTLVADENTRPDVDLVRNAIVCLGGDV